MKTPHLPTVTLQWGETAQQEMDEVLVEEPLEIEVVGPTLSLKLGVFLRTPGHDESLVLGLLCSQGLIHSAAEVRVAFSTVHGQCGRARAFVQEDRGIQNQKDRLGLVHSGCGWCGSDLVAWCSEQFSSPSNTFSIGKAVLCQMPASLKEKQPFFAKTGGSHAAALMDEQGTILSVMEDVGRHNAVDKIIGAALINQAPILKECALFLSGRAGFELVYKAAMVGIPVVAAIGATSSLAVALARESGMTLVGFVKENRLNIYAHGHRIKAE